MRRWHRRRPPNASFCATLNSAVHCLNLFTSVNTLALVSRWCRSHARTQQSFLSISHSQPMLFSVTVCAVCTVHRARTFDSYIPSPSCRRPVRCLHKNKYLNLIYFRLIFILLFLFLFGIGLCLIYAHTLQPDAQIPAGCENKLGIAFRDLVCIMYKYILERWLRCFWNANVDEPTKLKQWIWCCDTSRHSCLGET